MKNPKTPQPDPVSSTVAHEGVNKPMNDPMGTSSNASSSLDADKLKSSNNITTDALTDSDEIDPDRLELPEIDTEHDNLQQGLTEIHRQNIDESRIDEVLVEDSLDDDHYPTIKDIADNDAVAHSHEDK